jgi:hypothetical protein
VRYPVAWRSTETGQQWLKGKEWGLGVGCPLNVYGEGFKPVGKRRRTTTVDCNGDRRGRAVAVPRRSTRSEAWLVTPRQVKQWHKHAALTDE